MKYQLGSGGNKIVTAKQWKERLPKSYLWIDFCCIPQMAIPLTEELLGFDEKIEEAPGPEGGAFGGSGDFGGRGDCDESVCFGGSSGGGGGSLMMVKAATVLHELGSVPVRRSKSLVRVLPAG